MLAGQEGGLLPDRIIETLICTADPSQNYALYLPPDYSPDIKWPVLFSFDPGARGGIPVERFRDAARQLGYIVAGSNNSRNGPYDVSIQAMNAMWEDTHRRFSIDDRRIYLAGFSGGARVVSLIAKLKPGAFAGIILCGAGLAQDVTAEDLKSTPALGMIGNRDPNFLEMMDLKKRFESLIDRLLKKESEIGREKEKNGDLLEAYRLYRGMVSLFKGIRDVELIEKNLERLASDKFFQQNRRKSESMREKEREIVRRAQESYFHVENGDELNFNVAAAVQELRIPFLLKQISKQEETESDLAARVLAGICLDTGYFGRAAMEKREFSKAVYYFGIGRTAAAYDSHMEINFLYSEACALAMNGEKKKALNALRRVVEKGEIDPRILMREPSLVSLRENEEFVAMARSQDEKKNEWHPGIADFKRI